MALQGSATNIVTGHVSGAKLCSRQDCLPAHRRQRRQQGITQAASGSQGRGLQAQQPKGGRQQRHHSSLRAAVAEAPWQRPPQAEASPQPAPGFSSIPGDLLIVHMTALFCAGSWMTQGFVSTVVPMGYLSSCGWCRSSMWRCSSAVALGLGGRPNTKGSLSQFFEWEHLTTGPALQW